MNKVFSPKVTIIDPIIKTTPAEIGTAIRKLRVAAYARVSTEQDEQQNSYEAQVNHYGQYIRNNTSWEFAGIYSDEGITGTSTKKRDGFNRMIADAEAGKIDMILTKSISRFARNTVDTLQTVRHLKELGVEVIFEKENIHSLDRQGEVILTIMSSLAQEESRSISENVKWGHRRSMEEGNVSMAYGRFLGYRRGKDGRPEIVPEEASIIRDIYQDFLSGKTINWIAKHLTELGVKTPSGKEVWAVSTVRSILSNEKYKGDALLQKTYTADFLTKKVKKNDGELPQVYVKDSHPAIISPDVFDLVQVELKKRSQKKNRFTNSSPFSTKIVCGECGAYYGRKVFHSNDKYRTIAWYCNSKYNDNKVCNTPTIREEDLKAAYCLALGQAISQTHAEDDASDIEEAKQYERLQCNKAEASRQLENAVRELRVLIEENARRSQDQNEFNIEYQELVSHVDACKAKLQSAEKALLEYAAKKEALRRFRKATAGLVPGKIKLTDEIIIATCDHMVVGEENDSHFSIQFYFTDGNIIDVTV